MKIQSNKISNKWENIKNYDKNNQITLMEF